MSKHFKISNFILFVIEDLQFLNDLIKNEKCVI